MCTKFYLNRLSFVEDMIKTFGVYFSVRSVYRRDPDENEVGELELLHSAVVIWYVRNCDNESEC